MPANASTKTARLLIAGLALAGCALATYLSLFQLHVISHVWDPIFHEGSERVLHSSISRAIRRWTLVPDSLLGAAGYASEVVLALLAGSSLGGKHQWLSTLLKINSLALAAASLFLVVMQTFFLHSWCFLCLLSAAVSFAIIGILVSDRLARAG